MAAKKYKGKDLSLLFDGTQEINADGTSIVLDNEDAEEDATTFADLQDGDPKQWFFTINAVSDYGPSTFWRLCWENAGQDVAFILKPHGNAVATDAQPHFTGTARINAKPPIGGSAGDVFTFEARLDVDGVPEMKIAA